MKKIIVILLIISMLGLLGCTKKIDISPTVAEKLTSTIETYKQLRDEFEDTKYDEGKLQDLINTLETNSDLTIDEKLALEKTIDLCKKYMLWEMHTILIPDKAKANQALSDFDKSYEEIVKYLK